MNPGITHKSIENSFKLALLTQLQGDSENAITLYHDVCEKVESLLKENPGSQEMLRYTSFSVHKIADIYREKADYERACAFLNAEKHLLQFLSGSDKAKKRTPESLCQEVNN